LILVLCAVIHGFAFSLNSQKAPLGRSAISPTHTAAYIKMRYSTLSAALFVTAALAATISPRMAVYNMTIDAITDVVTINNPSISLIPNADSKSLQKQHASADCIGPVAISASAPDPSTSSGDGSPMSGDKSILSVVNKYREKYNRHPLKWSDQLQANAQKTTNNNNGVTQNHELNKGSSAQCLSPGFSTPAKDMNLRGLTPFEMSYLSWMCEKKTDSELQTYNNGGIDVCALVTGPKSIIKMQLTELGHYNILTSESYKVIGCAFTANPNATQEMWTGIWGCDLGF
jgi:hypothetical protein